MKIQNPKLQIPNNTKIQKIKIQISFKANHFVAGKIPALAV